MRQTAAWLSLLYALGCAKAEPHGGASPKGKTPLTSTPVESAANTSELVFPSLPLVDVSEETLASQDALDLRGKLNFMALAESIGITGPDGAFHALFDAGTLVPVERTQFLGAVQASQTSIDMDFWRHSSERAEDQHLGTMRIAQLTPGSASEPSVAVKLQIDGHGDLHISASDATTGRRYSTVRVGP